MTTLDYKSSWFAKRDPVGKEISPEPADRVVVAIRCLLSFLIFTVPWYYGTVDWTSQYVYLMVAIPICVIAFCALVYCHFRSKSPTEAHEKIVTAPPWPTVIFIAIAAWALLQSIPWYSIRSENGPNSVAIQRLYLGESVPAIEESLKLGGGPSGVNDFLPERFKDHKIGWSVEPLHTKAAIGMVALVGAMIWFGRAYFSTQRGLPWLLTLITFVGVGIAMFGIAGLVSWSSTNFLGLKKAGSFGPFVSRNSGGCFLNICLSASIGLTVWAFEHDKRKRTDQRYATFQASIFERVLGRIEAVFGQLTTFQIACVIASGVLFASVLATASRGASMGAVVMLFTLFVVSTGRGASPGRILVALIFLTIGAGFLFWFELDDRLRERLDQSVWNEDFEYGRRLIWSIAAKASTFYFWTGGGLGTFHYSHLPFQSTSTLNWYYHAESIYWEALVDLGWVGALAIVSVMATFVYILWPKNLDVDGTFKRKLGTARITALSLLLSVGLHSFFDFALILPGCFVLTSVLLGALYGACHWEGQTAPRKSNRSRTGSLQRRISSSQSETSRAGSVEDSKSSSSSKQKSLREISALAETHRGRIGVTIAVLTILLGMMCYSIPSLHLLGKADRMRLWSVGQNRVATEKRAANASVLLGGIWGKSDAGLDRCPDALRYIAFAILNDFKRMRTDELASRLEISNKQAGNLATPVISHIALAKIKNNPVDVEKFFIANEQQARWNKSKDLLSQAIVNSPLDWRINYGLYVLEYTLPDDQAAALARRLQRITTHQPSIQMQMAAVEYTLGRTDNSLSLLQSAVSGQITVDVQAAKLLAEWYPDGSVPISIFPQDAASLLRVAGALNKTRFPATHSALVDMAAQAADKLSRLDPMRSVYQARIAIYKGEYAAALDHYKNALRRNISDNKLRVEMITAAIQANQIEIALDELETLRYYDPNSAQIRSLEQMIEKAKSGN